MTADTTTKPAAPSLAEIDAALAKEAPDAEKGGARDASGRRSTTSVPEYSAENHKHGGGGDV